METIVISLGVILLAVLGIVVSNLIVIPLFGENFRNSLPILYILLFASAFSAINSFMENYFFVENKTKSLLPISVTKLISFITFSLLLLPYYSINGIAYASLISSLLVTGMIIYSVRK